MESILSLSILVILSFTYAPFSLLCQFIISYIDILLVIDKTKIRLATSHIDFRCAVALGPCICTEKPMAKAADKLTKLTSCLSIFCILRNVAVIISILALSASINFSYFDFKLALSKNLHCTFIDTFFL